jgi:mannose-1-phosphate guanylyltransferase/mannose-6-phosphate isomerase
MITVIIAGGSGTRLWPLSTSSYPKQLLKLTNDKSMVQNTYDRARAISEHVYIVPDISHAHHIKEQLKDVDEEHFVVEPGRRGTANAIVAALAHISKRHGAEEPIAFVHADHHIRDLHGFTRSFMTAAEVSSSRHEIALIGIEPTYPAVGFGYIERDGELKEYRGVYHVESFKEKPDFDTAKKYMKSGNYLWNCGYFVGSVNTFVKEMEQYSPSLKTNFDSLVNIENPQSKEYTNTYLGFKNEVIDIALIEKSKSLVVVPASFDWMDIGSFKDLHEANETDELGNYILGEEVYSQEVENVFVRNEEKKPVAVIGLDNIVVVNTKDGVLVARKDLSHKVGDIAKRIQS